VAGLKATIDEAATGAAEDQEKHTHYADKAAINSKKRTHRTKPEEKQGLM
jgi:hypothetical protein